MKFLADLCAGRRLAAWLRSQGHDIVESRDRGLDPGDRVLLAWADAEGRILVTMDKDFGSFIFLKNCFTAAWCDFPMSRWRSASR